MRLLPILAVAACFSGSQIALADEQESRKRAIASLKRELLRSDIAPNSAGIREYLRTITGWERKQTDATELARQLGADGFRERRAAQRALVNLPRFPVDLLEKASRDADPERASRAANILRQDIARQTQSALVVMRAIHVLELEGLTQELTRIVFKFRDEKRIVRAARRAMEVVATAEDIPFLSSQVKPDGSTPVLTVSIAALRNLADPSLADEFTKWARNRNMAEVARLEAALSLADLGDRRSPGAFVDLMVEAETAGVRNRSRNALQLLTGQNFPFAAYEETEVRAEQTEAWRTWIENDGRDAKLNYPLTGIQSTGSLLNGHTLVALNSANLVIEYDEAMKEVWTFESKYPCSAERMENGNILIAEYHGRRIIEVNRDKEIVRQYPVRLVCGAQPLPNGNILVASQGLRGGNAVELDREGKMVREFQTEHRWIDNAFRMDNGHTLVSEVTQNTDPVIAEFNTDGERIWTYTVQRNSSLDTIQALENGNVLISLVGGEVIEVNKKTKSVVWKLENVGARAAYRLEDGNTLILTKERLFEVDSQGEEIASTPLETTSGSVRR